MKKTKNLFKVMLVSSALLLTIPGMAQTSDSTSGTTSTEHYGHDDSGKWGLLGLLGLAGLLGLRKRDDRTHHNVNR